MNDKRIVSDKDRRTWEKEVREVIANKNQARAKVLNVQRCAMGDDRSDRNVDWIKETRFLGRQLAQILKPRPVRKEEPISKGFSVAADFKAYIEDIRNSNLEPLWRVLPEKAKYVAIDESGDVYSYEDEPIAMDRTWTWGGFLDAAKFLVTVPNWVGGLRSWERPAPNPGLNCAKNIRLANYHCEALANGDCSTLWPVLNEKYRYIAVDQGGGTFAFIQEPWLDGHSLYQRPAHETKAYLFSIYSPEPVLYERPCS